MKKIKNIGTNIYRGQVVVNPNQEIEVEDSIAEYLLETFKDATFYKFVVVNSKKESGKSEVAETKEPTKEAPKKRRTKKGE